MTCAVAACGARRLAHRVAASARYQLTGNRRWISVPVTKNSFHRHQVFRRT
jgi:hypothetical protein